MLKKNRRGRPRLGAQTKQLASLKLNPTLSRSPRQKSRWARFRFCFKIPRKDQNTDRFHSLKWRRTRHLTLRTISWWITLLFSPQMEIVAIRLTSKVLIEYWITTLSIFISKQLRTRTSETIINPLIYFKLKIYQLTVFHFLLNYLLKAFKLMHFTISIYLKLFI